MIFGPRLFRPICNRLQLFSHLQFFIIGTGISTSTVSAGDEVRDVTCSESATLGAPAERKNRGVFIKNSTVANLSRDFASVLADKIGKESWSMDEKTRRLIKTRLERFFFLEDSEFKLNIVMKVMKKRLTKDR